MSLHRRHAQKPVRRLASSLLNSFTQCFFPSGFETWIPIYDPEVAERFSIDQKDSGTERVLYGLAIGVLPDDVLLNIFEFFRGKSKNFEDGTWPWHVLVHVCRRWRRIIFSSPRSLDLRVLCRSRTPVRRAMDIWPALPIVIRSFPYFHNDGDNVIAALEHRDRVSWIDLFGITSSELKKYAAVMQKPFPVLTSLRLELNDTMPPVLTDAFLGGSAPHLRRLYLRGIPFPTLPRLLLSSYNLVNLRLWNIPTTGYISPEAMGIMLSGLTRLRSLVIRFQYASSRSDITSPPPPSICAVLPALTVFEFSGASEYLEYLVAQFDAPVLNYVLVQFLKQPTFDVQQLTQFIRRAEALNSPYRAEIIFLNHAIYLSLNSSADPPKFLLQISCNQSSQQVSLMEQICIQCLPLLFRVERLELYEGSFYRPRRRPNLDFTPWLELFRLFTAVRSLYISTELEPLIAPALQGLTGRRAAEVLPTLQTLFLEGLQPDGSVHGTIGQFVATRRLSGHPVVVQCWHR